jgi:hypothetical protein
VPTPIAVGSMSFEHCRVIAIGNRLPKRDLRRQSILGRHRSSRCSLPLSKEKDAFHLRVDPWVLATVSHRRDFGGRLLYSSSSLKVDRPSTFKSSPVNTPCPPPGPSYATWPGAAEYRIVAPMISFGIIGVDNPRALDREHFVNGLSRQASRITIFNGAPARSIISRNSLDLTPPQVEVLLYL